MQGGIVKVKGAFPRILGDLTRPHEDCTVQEVDATLHNLQIEQNLTGEAGGEEPVHSQDGEDFSNSNAAIQAAQQEGVQDSPANSNILDVLFTKPDHVVPDNVVPVRENTEDNSLENQENPPAPTEPTKRRRPRRVFDMSTDFLKMFRGPLPQDIIAALTVIFNLEEPGADDLDEAMAAIAGEAIDDFQDASDNLQTESVRAAA